MALGFEEFRRMRPSRIGYQIARGAVFPSGAAHVWTFDAAADQNQPDAITGDPGFDLVPFGSLVQVPGLSGQSVATPSGASNEFEGFVQGGAALEQGAEGDFSFHFALKTDAPTENSGIYFAAFSTDTWTFWLTFDESGYVTLEPDAGPPIVSSKILSASEWARFVGVWTESEAALRLYVDGVLALTWVRISAGSGGYYMVLQNIGQRLAGYFAWDEAYTWPRRLTADEVVAASTLIYA